MAEAPQLFCAGATHHDAPLEVRERLAAVPEARLQEWLADWRSQGRLVESALLRTCNRLECYGLAADPALAEEFARRITENAGLDGPACFRLWRHEAGAIHLFEVAASLDSQLIGETEILGQLKEAYAAATQQGTVGPALHRLFQKAIQSAKWVRSNTAIGRGLVSVGSVAADLAEDIFGDLATATGLVIGAGEVGEKTARALLARGLRELVLTNRTAAHADDLAVTLGARAVPFQALDSLLAQVDILLSSTASPVPILGLERVSRALDRRKRPLFLIDLALPRDIDPSVGALPDVFLYNLDDLAAIAETNRKAREAELATARMEVQRRALAAWQAVAQRGSV